MSSRRDRTVHLRLDVDEFSKLVSGKVVEQEADVTMQGVVVSALSPVRVRFILSDIGWGRMLRTIGEAMAREDQ